MRRSSVVSVVLAVFVVALAVVQVSPARAQSPGDLPYVTSISFLPNPPCDSIPTRLVIGGSFPSSCGRVLGNDGTTIYISDPSPPCAGCFQGPFAWADTLDLGLLAQGNFQVRVRLGIVDFCSDPDDTTYHEAQVAFAVGSHCPPNPPPPLDPMTYVTSFRITSTRDTTSDIICEGDSILLRVGGVLPDNCHFLRSILLAPSPATVVPVPITVRLVFDNGCCTDQVCVRYPTQFQASLMIPPVPPGWHNLTMVGYETCCREQPLETDPVGYRNQGFHVASADSCGITPPPIMCMWPTWLHDQTAECDAYVSKTGDPAAITGMVHTTIALAGIQGQVHAFSPSGIPLMVHSMEPIGLAAGMHLTWEQTANGAKFVLFADQGAPLPPTSPRRPTQFLRIRWVPGVRDTRDSSIIDPSTRWHVAWNDMFGSDIAGNLVPLCPFDMPGIFADAATICVGQPAACDLNGDAHSDVRDLVLMAHCLASPGACPWSTSLANLDCDGDTDFDFDDLYCCARNVLGIPPCPDCPDDSVRVEPRIAFSFGTPVQTPAGIEIPVRITHAGLIGAARFGFSLPPELAGRAWIDLRTSKWLPVSRGTGNGIEFGMIRLPSITTDVEPPYVDATLHIAVDSGTRPSGQIALDQVQISGPDGVMLKTDLGSQVVRLGPGLGVSLSQARPNPFVTSTTFRLMLDAAVDAAEIGVYDLSGRRIATLHKGALPVGSHPFTWNGRIDGGGKARAGVYFVRATAGSQTTNQKLVMLKD